MKRKTLLEKLQKLIPSFQREFLDKDFYGELGWICMDRPGKDIPESIPPHFLEGIKVTREDGTVWTVYSEDSHPALNEMRLVKGLPVGRRVRFEYMNYPGHPHLYGKLEIRGVELKRREKNGTVICSGVSSKDIIEHPELKQASYCWDMELGRILPEEDLKKGDDWKMYESGCRTNRFYSHKELLLTALYVALSRVEGEFYLENERYSNSTKDRLILSVDANDDVTFYNGINKTLEIA